MGGADDEIFLVSVYHRVVVTKTRDLNEQHLQNGANTRWRDSPYKSTRYLFRSAI
jgi:hypothetical protein